MKPTHASMKRLCLFLLSSIVLVAPVTSFGYKDNPFAKPTDTNIVVNKISRKSRPKRQTQYDFKDIALRGIFYVDKQNRKALIKIKDKLHSLSINEMADGIKVYQISRSSVTIGHGRSRKTLTLASKRILDAQ